jgi:hypothetical protein
MTLSHFIISPFILLTWHKTMDSYSLNAIFPPIINRSLSFHKPELSNFENYGHYGALLKAIKKLQEKFDELGPMSA